MYKAFVVASREYLTLVKTKSFRLGLLVAPLLAVLAAVLSTTSSGPAEHGPKLIVIVDRSGAIGARLEEHARAAGLQIEHADPQRVDAMRLQELGDRLKSGAVLAVVDIDPDALVDGVESARVYVENVAGPTSRWLDGLVTRAVQIERLRKAGVANARVQALMKPVHVVALPPPGPEERTWQEVAARLLVPFAILMLVMIGVTTAATPLLQAVVEEKQQRISEVLLGAISPIQLMWGKLLGGTALGMTVLGFYLLLGIGVIAYIGYAPFIPLDAVALTLGSALIAMVMYGAVFLSLGAAANDLKDAQGLLMPIMLLLMGPVVAIPAVTADPNGPLATGLSMFPLTAPMTMPVRLSTTSLVPTWQIVLSPVGVLLTTIAIVWAGGRVFRIGILSQGKTPSVRELIGWIVRG